MAKKKKAKKEKNKFCEICLSTTGKKNIAVGIAEGLPACKECIAHYNDEE